MDDVRRLEGRRRLRLPAIVRAFYHATLKERLIGTCHIRRQLSRESGSPAPPLTPPDMRVRIRRFGERQGTKRRLALEPLLAVRAVNDSALWQDPGGFTAFAPSVVPLSREVGLHGSFLEHPAPGTSTVQPFPAHTCDLTGVGSEEAPQHQG